MRTWQIGLERPAGDVRAFLNELRTRPGVTIRNVRDEWIVVEVEAPDERTLRSDWAGVRWVMRVDGGWSGDWWDGLGATRPHEPFEVGRDGDHRVFAVPFHHVDVDDSGRRLTLFWNGLAAYRPGPASAEEHDDGVIVTVTELAVGGGNAVALAGEGRRVTVTLREPLGDRPVWDRVRGAVRPRY